MRTQEKLAQNKAAGKDSLIGYFPLGYPSLTESIEAAVAMVEEGVDVLELGIPYSDPVMDGLVIQEATEQALQSGFKLSQVFSAVEQVAKRTSAPVLVMTYWNPVLQFGVEKFAKELKQAGGAGLITPDLIPDEAGDWLKVSDELELDRVFLATPSSTPSRVKRAADLSRGFVYAVSTMGITGERGQVDLLARKVVSSIRAEAPTALTAVGIGISSGEQASAVNEYADGAIVGSAFVRAYQDNGLDGLRQKVRDIVSGLNK